MGKVLTADSKATSPFQVRAVLTRALASRKRIETWGDLLDVAEAFGITRSTPVQSIEFGISGTVETRRLAVEWDDSRDEPEAVITEAVR